MPDVKEYFEQNRARYKDPLRVNIREIFVRDKIEADDVLRRIKIGEDFAKLAEKESLRPWAARRAGEFGFFGPGMHGEIGKKALTMRVGEMAGPVEIRDTDLGHGFSIFVVIARKEERFKTFSEAQKQVENDLLEREKQKTLTRFLARLKNKHAIDIDHESLAEIPTTGDIAKGRRIQMFAVPQ
jgi:parvulin-like peptidyl-prolyl isomerase